MDVDGRPAVVWASFCRIISEICFKKNALKRDHAFA